MYTEVEYQDNDGYPCLLFYESKDEEGALTGDSHLIPMQAIADRMELLGLESIEQTLEYLGREFNQASVSDTLHEGMQNAYGEVVRSEFAQSLMPTPMVQETGRQTLMAPLAISPEKRTKLEDVRDDVLSKLGMRSVVHTEPMLRAMDSSRPVERTRPAAAEALGASEDAVASGVSLVQEHLQEVMEWRTMNLAMYIPQLKDELMQMQLNNESRS